MNRRKYTWATVALAAALAVTTAGCPQSPPGGASSMANEREAPAPRDPGLVDDELIGHVQAGRFAEAYALTTRAYQQSVSLKAFTAALKANRYLKTSKLIGCFRVVTYEEAVHLRECIMHTELGKTYATLHYAIDEGEWRMTGITIGGTPAFPGPG